MSAAASAPRMSPRLRKLIIATSVGNALEWYDIGVYGYFVLYVTKAFFPAADPVLGLLLSLGTFAISYLSRPLGAIVLGSYADRAGRKAAMLHCLLLMLLGTAMLALMPTYASIGILAPLGILVGRLLQGFSAGGEFGSATAFLVEHHPERRGYIASWQFASQGLAALLASLFGVALTTYMSEATLNAWGWRLPFAFGLLIGPVGLYIRRHLEDPVRAEPPSGRAAIVTVLATQKSHLLVAIGCLAASTAVNYLFLYIPTYAVKDLGLSPTIGFASTCGSSLILAVCTPFVGHVSDRLGRTRLMMLSGLGLLVSFYPCFVLLAAFHSAGVLIPIVLWLALLKAAYFGALPALMSELFPAATRATGLAVSYNLGVSLFGGCGPLIMVWLTGVTGSSLAPSYYLTAVTVQSIIAIVIARARFGIT